MSLVSRCPLYNEKRGEVVLKNKRSNGGRSEADVVAEAKKKRTRGERSQQWQMTENNPDYTKKEAVERLSSVGTALYGIGCSEVGESGTSHVHAYVVWKNAIELGSLKKLFPRAHFEKCKGSVQSNIDYISKDDTEPYEVGERPLVVSEWKKDVSSEVVALILECGLSPIEILSRYPRYCDYVVKNFRNLSEIYASNRLKRK